MTRERGRQNGQEKVREGLDNRRGERVKQREWKRTGGRQRNLTREGDG